MAKEKETIRHVRTRIPDDVHRAAKMEAARRGITLTEFIAELLARAVGKAK